MATPTDPIQVAEEARIAYDALKERHRRELDEFNREFVHTLVQAFERHPRTSERAVLEAFRTTSSPHIREAKKLARMKTSKPEIAKEQRTWGEPEETETLKTYVSNDGLIAQYRRAKHPITGALGKWVHVPNTETVQFDINNGN